MILDTFLSTRHLTIMWLEAKIKIKWLRDKQFLPLSPAHWELYRIIHRLCWRELHDFPNLINCRDFNDKIQWLKLFDQSPEIVRCSDKIQVRDYIRERVGDQYLVKLYQIHDHFSQIDFNALPNAFVIKTNHDSGTVILVRDKSKLDYQTVEARIEAALKRPYGWMNGEWAYSYVQPKILVEELLDQKSLKPPPDYKFHCVNGYIRWLQFIFDRGNTTKECIIDANGHLTNIHFDHNMQHCENFDTPYRWIHIKNIIEKIAVGFKYVRIDVYNIKEKIYVGEMTFYPLMGCYKSEGQKKLGQLLDFDRTTIKPFLLPELEKACSRFSLYPAQSNMR